jgi:uncharacterized protein YdeI (YjbR/CyaY-like superfamily)
MDAVFFSSPDEFREWLGANHDSADELWVGFHKRATGKPSLTWPQSVDQALCFGWIDGLRKSIDDQSYVIRFTPRRPGSNWSLVNIRRAEELIRTGRMQSAGLRAFEAREARKSGVYSFEQRQAARFDRNSEARFKSNTSAWKFFESQPPGYRRLMTFWIMSGKQEATRARRLDALVAESAAGRRVTLMTRVGRGSKATTGQ